MLARRRSVGAYPDTDYERWPMGTLIDRPVDVRAAEPADGRRCWGPGGHSGLVARRRVRLEVVGRFGFGQNDSSIDECPGMTNLIAQLARRHKASHLGSRVAEP
jgi:hypothetical protein